MADLPARSRRVVGLALLGSATLVGGLAVAVLSGLGPVAAEVRGLLASVLGAVAAVDVLLGFWFLRSSLST